MITSKLKTLLSIFAMLLYCFTASAATTTLDDWTSTNTAHGSTSQKTYTFETVAGEELSFSWSVSSEANYDKLIVTLDGVEVLNKSGEYSSTFTKTLSAGSHTLVVKYTKDGSNSSGADQAKVWNIVVTGGASNVTYSISGNTATVVSATNISTIVIPSYVTIDGITYAVTSIGSNAFLGCNNLTSITIPASVTSIANYAFDNCTALKEVVFEDGGSTLSLGYNSYYVSGTGQGLFYDCPLEEVYLGRNLNYSTSESYGYSPFYNKPRLTSVTIGDNVTSIGNNAFYSCSNLTTITIPASVTNIANYAFDNCTALKKVVFEDGRSTLSLGYNDYNSTGQGLFYDCPLESVYLGRNLSYNANRAYGYSPFYNKTQLNAVTIGNNVTSIGSYAFEGCYNLKKVINFSNLSLSVGSSSYGYVAYYAQQIINSTPTTIDDFQFYTNNHIHYLLGYNGQNTDLVLPNSYNGANYQIDDYAFFNCNITSITIPDSVTSIGNYAFDNCISLKEIIFEDGVDTLALGYNGDYQGLFYDCPLKLIYQGRNISYAADQTHGYSPFYNKKSLRHVVIGNDVKSIEPYAFCSCDSLSSLTIGSGVLSISNKALWLYPDQENDIYQQMVIPDKVIWLTNTPPVGYAYANGRINYTSNSEYTLLNNVQEYPYLSSWFEVGGVIYVPMSPAERACHAIDCTYDSDITAVNVSKEVSYMGVEMEVREVKPYTFCKNDFITDASISHYGNIGDKAFYICSALETIRLGDSICSLGDTTFYHCAELRAISIPDSVKVIGHHCFDGCQLLTEISIPESTIAIGNWAFSGCTQLADVVIEDRDEVLNLGCNGAAALFADCPLDSVYIGGKITYNTSREHGYSPFYRNTSLRAVVITDSETQIYDNEFYGCTNLTDVTMGNGVNSIGNYAFSGCSSLESFSFGSSMRMIGAEAFSDCVRMASITSHTATPPICQSQALDDINKWTCVLNVPQNKKQTYQVADQWKEFFFVEDEVVAEYFVLTYMVDGMVHHTEMLKGNNQVTMLAEPTKEGYTFSGWDKTLTTMPNDDVTINGTFNINKYQVTFAVNGVVMQSEQLEYGAEIVSPTLPEREGYTLEGWEDIALTVPAEDLYYNAVYVPNIYKVYYFVGANLVHIAEVACGNEIPMYIVPNEEDKTFAGWGGMPEAMPAGDLSLYATFNAAKYTVTFKIEGEVISTYSLGSGEDVVVPEAPQKEGYTFIGWKEVENTDFTKNVTYEGSYSINTYKVYYYVGEELVFTDEVVYGKKIPDYIYEPTDTDDEFVGWIGTPYSSMPAHDVIFKANMKNGIEELLKDKENAVIYDLNGRRVLDTENLRGGLYLINGRKVMIR